MAPARSCCSSPSGAATPCAPRIAAPRHASRRPPPHPLACVALAPVTTAGQNAVAVDLLADVLRGTARRSDAIGRVGPEEFAVIAPGTDRAGAVLLAERLARGVKTLAGATPGLRAGYDAVGNARYTPIEPKNLLSRATTALRAAKGQGAPNWIQWYTLTP